LAFQLAENLTDQAECRQGKRSVNKRNYKRLGKQSV